MINMWILDNFKSIDEEKKLEFRKLTIFTGANSSGKSTILQSILLVTQTLQNPSPSKSVVLNGWFKKLGSYNDIVFGGDISKNITIGFSISDSHSHDKTLQRLRRIRLNGNRIMTIPSPPSDEETQTTCKFTITSEGIEGNLQPGMESVDISTPTDGFHYQVTRWDIKSELGADIYDALKDKLNEKDTRYTINKEWEEMLSYRRLYDDVKWNPIGVTFDHFLPSQILSYCSVIDIMKMKLTDFIKRNGPFYYDHEDIGEDVLPYIQNKAIEIVNQLTNKIQPRNKTDEKNYASIKKKFTMKKLQKLFANIALGEDEKNRYISQIVEKLNDMPIEYELDMRMAFNYDRSSEITEFFRDRINYLGPLREEPRSLYPLGNDGSTTEVGLRGENTAAVFYNNRDRLISYIAPSSFDSLENVKFQAKEGTLTEAVTQWLRYMDVANEVITDDLGKIGHTLRIKGELGIEQDLTNVGVGVSQVLPILVMSLLAKKGDTIILEQPELHLHPKVQSRLADFFVSMNALGKQCIIETHSEYLINRLRLLVAKSDDTKVADDTMIYFVEKDKKSEASVYRQITINQYGKIEKWPEGFFDEAENLASQIVAAAFEKKRRERQNMEK